MELLSCEILDQLQKMGLDPHEQFGLAMDYVACESGQKQMEE